MERRKFLIGAGSAAVGSSALIGSGAFSSVTANRGISVTVSDDASAFLSLTAPEDGENTKYADTSGDTISLDISGHGGREGQEGGEGLNKEATTTFLQLFKIENKGTNTVGVKLENFGTDNLESMGWFVGQHGGDTLSHDNIQEYDWDNPDEDDRILAPGESVWVGAFFYRPEDAFEGDYTFTVTAANENSATSNGL